MLPPDAPRGFPARLLMNMPMRTKLFTVSMTVTLAAIFLASSVVLITGWNNSRNDLLNDVTTHGRMVARNTAAALAFGDVDDAEQIVSSLEAVSHVESGGIYTADGRLLAGYERSGAAPTPSRIQMKTEHRFVENGLEILQPVVLNNDRVGTVYIRSNLDPVNRFVRSVLVTLGIAIGLAVLITLALTNWFQRFVTLPISRLASVARKIRDDGDFTLRLHRESRDEVGLLADTMNETLEAVAQSERNYREIFDGVYDAIFVHDANTGIILDVNEGTLKLYGIAREDAIGRPIDELSAGIAPFDSAAAAAKIQLAINEGPQTFEWSARRKSGETFWVEVNLRYTRIANEERIIAVVRDTGERRRAQEMLIQTEKMMSIGGLAAGIAHEINNPLAGILQSGAVLKERLFNREMSANIRAAEDTEVDIDKLHRYMTARRIDQIIDRINASGNRAAEIVANMLSFARKSESNRRVEATLSELLDRTVTLAATDYSLKKHYDFRQIEVVREFDPEVPKIVCEPSKLQQVFLNLLRNGAEAMYEKHALEPGYQPRFKLRISSDADRQSVNIEIEDNGPGINADIRAHVFEPFFTTKPIGQGTGLGLSVSYYIITEDHGGSMTVTSSPDLTTCFSISLPVNLPYDTGVRS